MILKSPLRYPGGKQRIVKQLGDKLPTHFDEYREPFLGGGSVFFYMQNIKPDVKHWWINDKFEPVHNFWNQIAHFPENVLSIIKAFRTDHPDGKDLHGTLRRLYKEFHDEEDTAAAFYILNRCSFSGLTFSGGYSQAAFDTRLTDNGIKKLSLYSPILKTAKITNLDYNALLQAPAKNGDVFVFMDPPYDIKASTLYGNKGNTHKDFDHSKFADDCKNCAYKWMITYNDNQNIRDLFSWANIQEIPVLYSMNSNSKKAVELVITNY
jgi:DNA adenine methylase